MLDFRVGFIASFEGTARHGDVTLKQAHVDLLIVKDAVDDVRVVDRPPHGTPGVVDDLATVQDDMLWGVLGIFRVVVLVVVGGINRLAV